MFRLFVELFFTSAGVMLKIDEQVLGKCSLFGGSELLVLCRLQIKPLRRFILLGDLIMGAFPMVKHWVRLWRRLGLLAGLGALS